jgi:hypothetical protein
VGSWHLKLVDAIDVRGMINIELQTEDWQLPTKKLNRITESTSE